MDYSFQRNLVLSQVFVVLQSVVGGSNRIVRRSVVFLEAGILF